MASWLSRNLVPVLSTIGGAALTATGVGGGIGIPMMVGGAGALSADATNERNKKEAERAFGRSQEEARRQERFQETMSNTAQTRARNDAINAGYNPMLPAINGNQATSPQGSSAKYEKAQFDDHIGKGLASAMQMKQMQIALDGQTSQIGLNNALGAKAVADANSSTASAKESITRENALRLQLKAIGKKADLDSKKTDYDLQFLPLDAYSQRINNSAATAGEVMSLFKTLPGGSKLYKNRKGDMLIDKDGVIKKQY